MEIRKLQTDELPLLLDLLEGCPPTDGQDTRALVARSYEHDPTRTTDNALMAFDHGRPIGCAQILPRWLLVLGHRIPTGGLSAFYVDPDVRGQGLGRALVEAATQNMRERGMEVSLAFSSNTGLLGELGWQPWHGQRTVLRVAEKGISPNSQKDSANEIELVPFDPESERGLSSVQAIHTAYSGSRHGTVIRDDDLWSASLALAGNPEEEFWIARRGGLAVAYARAAILDDALTVTEMGRFEDGAAALAQLIRHLLQPRDDDPFTRGGRSSAAVRSFLVLPTFDDIGLTVSLEQAGASSHPMDETRGLIRCLALKALAARLDVELFDEETPEAFLERILPPDGFVFWPADRF